MVQGQVKANVNINTQFSELDIQRLQEVTIYGFGPFAVSESSSVLGSKVSRSGGTSTTIEITGSLVGPHVLGIEVAKF